MFRKKKKSPSDELFLQFFCKSSESGLFFFVYMIRIRFFGPGELIQKYFRAALTTRAIQRDHTETASPINLARPRSKNQSHFVPRGLAAVVRMNQRN